MRLSDIMSAANLAIYAEVGLVLFLLVFVVVAFRVFASKAGAFDEQAMIPLSDEPVTPRSPSQRSQKK